MANGEYVTKNGKTYNANPVHRNGKAGKSQWAVALPVEHSVFDVADQRSWTDGVYYWGLHLDGGAAPLALGTLREFIAMFRSTAVGTGMEWHGYPAWPHQHEADLPSDQVLDDWEQSALITHAKRGKIERLQLWHF
jgi:hypothetical protein